MEETEKKLDASESIKLITDVIIKTRIDLREQSFCFLLWGWLITTASVLFYVLRAYAITKYYFLPFPVLVLIGIVVTVGYTLKNRFKSQSYLTVFLKQLWLVLGASFILLVFISGLERHLPFTYTILIGGIGTLVSGLTMRFKPMVIGGLIFLIIAVGSVFVDDMNKPLLQGIAVACGYLIPGYILKYSKNERSVDVQ